MNQSNPHVSVVIPTYNSQRYVTEAIDSVFAQTYTDHEIVVVDDGSTDDTPTVLASYGDSIRYIYQEHAGCASARNRGVEESRGQWVGFLDAKDIWLPQKLAIQMADLAAYPQAHAHAVNAYVSHDQHGETVDLFRHIGYDRHLRRSPLYVRRPLHPLLRYGFGWPQSVLTRRDILIEAGLFNERLCLWQDIDMLYRVAAYCNWVVNATPLVRLCRRDEDKVDPSRQSVERRLASHREFVLTYGTLYMHRNLTKREKRMARRCLSISLSTLGMEQCREHVDMHDARRNLRRGFTISPTMAGLAKLAAAYLPGSHGVRLVSRWQGMASAICRVLQGTRAKRACACVEALQSEVHRQPGAPSDTGGQEEAQPVDVLDGAPTGGGAMPIEESARSDAGSRSLGEGKAP
ncbi:MAG: glycosyltransferase [Chitinivibrionales bacterium]|nr:glycosyltransferase [Chitinivibrionales bacterium]